MDQKQRALRFQELHQRAGGFLMPNPWDPCSARILREIGFEALATSSAAAAAVLGRRDGQISRSEALDHVRSIVQATELPVAADLENGFGDDPAQVADTIRLAAEIGLVGGSIEDFGGTANPQQYDLVYASERVAAAAAAARALPFPFTLTARAENFVRGNPDLADTIRRLLAYQQAGADVLFAPALPDLAAVREVCAAVQKPVNFMVGIRGKSFSVPELVGVGVRRISFAASLYRAAMGGLIDAAKCIQNGGTFEYLDKAPTTADLNGYLC